MIKKVIFNMYIAENTRVIMSYTRTQALHDNTHRSIIISGQVFMNRKYSIWSSDYPNYSFRLDYVKTSLVFQVCMKMDVTHRSYCSFRSV